MRSKKKAPFSQSRKHSKYKITNWSEYNNFLGNMQDFHKNIFEIIEYKTFKYLFTAFSIFSILIYSYISGASSETPRNTHSLGMELMPSKWDELIEQIAEESSKVELLIASSKSLREALEQRERMVELAIQQYLEKLNESHMALHWDCINNMKNWTIEDEEDLLSLDDICSLTLENISTYDIPKENSDSEILKETAQLTQVKQSEKNHTSEHIELEKGTQLIQNNSKKAVINTDIHDKKVIAQKSIFKATIDRQYKIINIINQLIHNTRLDPSINIIKTATIVAGDEIFNIQSGVWMSGIYEISNQGLVDNINGYTGISKGGSIGFDTKIENDIIGIVYSNVHSVLKFKNNSNNNKGIINSYIITMYGQKELPKNLAVQALISVSTNFIKEKMIYSFNNNQFKSNLKHRNYTYNLEGLLHYNHLTKNNIMITPNIGLRYGKSLDGAYSEIGNIIQEISLTMKESNILLGILGTKVKIPLKDLKFNNLELIMHGSMERNFNEKTQRVNMIIQIFDNKFTQNYVMPKQPKIAYNIGASIVGNIQNTNISLEYNYYLNKHYQSHQGSIKIQMNL